MPCCPWCLTFVNDYADHNNFFGAYTCNKVNTPFELQGCKKLYHQTSIEAAASIFKENSMKPGVFGIAGPAIYFALTPEDTEHKAMSRGIILECWVNLGRVLRLTENGDYSLDKNVIQSRGHDSALIPRSRGHEYAVYDPKRVMKITKHDLSKTHL